MDYSALLTIETFIMFIFLLPFYIVFFFMIVAARHARNERRLTRELHIMAAEEEACHARVRSETRELEEKRAEQKRAQEEQTLLREAVRRASQPNDDSSDDESDLHIFFKNNRPGPSLSAPYNSPEKGDKRN